MLPVLVLLPKENVVLGCAGFCPAPNENIPVGALLLSLVELLVFPKTDGAGVEVEAPNEGG